MANQNEKILTAEQEAKLRQPVDEYVGKIQDKLDALAQYLYNKETITGEEFMEILTGGMKQ